MALAAAAIFDWSRPPAQQASRVLFERGVVASYRKFVRPVTARFVHCRFYPTCSEYAVQAVGRFGFPKGAWLSVRRLARCTPWRAPGTYDPVPPLRTR